MRRVDYTVSMKITLEYVAMLRVDGPASGSVMEVDHGITAGDLMTRLGIAAYHQRVVVPFVNDRKVEPGRVLQENDRVFLAMPVGGG